MKKYICLVLIMYSISVCSQIKCEQFALNKVKLLPSRFQRNMQRDSAWIASIPTDALLHSFRTTVGLFSGREGGYMTTKHLFGWESLDCDLRGHITGHLLSAMANLQMREKADSLVQGLRQVQLQYGNGYLSAFPETLIDRNIAGKSVWAPFYTLHKILQGLIDQYTMCGNQTALVIAREMGNWAYNKLCLISDEQRQIMLKNEFGGFNEAMYNLYAITRDEHHLWVARFFYHNEKIDKLKRGDTDLSTLHANTFIPKLLGECLNYELFADQQSRQAATLMFDVLTKQHSFVTGEVSDKEHLFDPQTQSAHLTGYNGENCCTYNLLKLSDHLFTYQPNSKIADYYERALYNHILGQQDTATSMVCYFTPLQTGAHRLYCTPDSSFWCCVGSGFECHSKYQSSIYFYTDNFLYINLFIPSEVDWNGTIVQQLTQFPNDNKTIITASKSINLKLRYPYWATYVKVNNKKQKADSDGYISIKNTKRIEVEFGMQVHKEYTYSDSSYVALLYGPIVLAGRLSNVQNPFSNPKKYNDYYTYDYGHYPDIPFADIEKLERLHFKSDSGIDIEPLYNMQHCRYVVYFKNK